MSNTPRALGGFPILALHPKALRQIGNLCFSERTPEELTNLSWEVRFFCGERGGDRSIGEANLRKGRSPFYGWRPCRPLQWKRHRRPPSLFIKKHCAKSGKPGFFGTNSGSINEPLMGGSFFVGERGGDRSIGEANLRKGRRPPSMEAALPPPSMGAVLPPAWLRRSAPMPNPCRGRRIVC